MTHNELLAKINYTVAIYEGLSVLDIRVLTAYLKALRAVVELHKPFQFESNPDEYKAVCQHCQMGIVGDEYPCETIRAIEKELK